MIKHKLESSYTVKSFTQHEAHKDKTLELISFSNYKSPKIDAAEVNITKTDWEFSNTNREWLSYLQEPLMSEMFDIYKNMGYSGFQVNEIWFQQYLQESEHGWHIHGSNFTNVYYLELPEGTPKTQIINPYNQKDIIEVDVKEGDLLTFPSYVLHKAPKNNSDKRKTIISFNTNVHYSDEVYGKNLL